jgi:hypothetical protein
MSVFFLNSFYFFIWSFTKFTLTPCFNWPVEGDVEHDSDVEDKVEKQD